MAGPTVIHTPAAGSGTGTGGAITAADYNGAAAHTIAGLYSRQPLWWGAGGNTALTSAGNAGGGSAITGSGTGSGYSGVGPIAQTRYASAATSGSVASASVNGAAYIPPTNALPSPGISVTGTLHFFDASYGTGATGARLGFGMTRVAANMFGADDGTAASNNSQGIWFSYSTNRGGNWKIVVYSSTTTTTLIDTGVAFTPGLWSFRFDFLESASSFDWMIRNIGVSSASGTVTSATAPFPANLATTYVLVGGLATLTTTARNVGIARMGIDLLEPL